MKSIYSMTLNELQDEFKKTHESHIFIQDIIDTIFILKKGSYSIFPLQDDKEYLEIKSIGPKEQLEFIEKFIKDTFPENLLKEIEQKQKECNDWVKEQENRIVKTFRVLAEKEEMLNKAISDNLNNNK